MDSTSAARHVLDVVYEVDIVSHGSFMVGLPLFGGLSCIVLCLMFHFDAVLEANCNVPNYLPSISAATGFAPEKYIWQIAIALTSLQNFRNDPMYYNYFQRNLAVSKQPWFARWNKANYVLGVIGNVGLLLGVNVSHLDDARLHKAGFALCTVFSLLRMMTTCALSKWTAHSPMTHEETVSLAWKRLLLLVNAASVVLTFYFYLRHYRYCEPGIYTLFALSEYVAIASNVVFRGLLAYDLKGASLMVAYKNKFTDYRRKSRAG